MKVDPRPPRQVHAHSGEHEIIKCGAAMVPNTEVLQCGSPGDERLSLRPKEVSCVEVLLPDISPVHETGFGIEAWTVINVKGLQVELASCTLNVELVSRSCGMRAV